jgi:hypothetical protein
MLSDRASTIANMIHRSSKRTVRLRAGDRVELRSPAEILATLDEHGCLRGLPFMPEMLGYFGKTFSVQAQVERACDTVGYTGVRRLEDTVILDELRCNGAAHAGCQAQCRFYWKEAWLRPVSSTAAAAKPETDDAFGRLQRLAMANVRGTPSTADEPTFRCQATELLRASESVGWWSARSFLHELTSGNVGPWRFASVMVRALFDEIRKRLGFSLDYPFRPSEMTGRGSVAPPPSGLQPGDLVQIRSGREISKTLSEKAKNKGLWFDKEMKAYCGQTARVKSKVERFIDEESGRLIELKSDCYILDNVVCQSHLSYGRWFCPRAIYPYWRECWLRPLEEETTEPTDRPPEGVGKVEARSPH